MNILLEHEVLIESPTLRYKVSMEFEKWNIIFLKNIQMSPMNSPEIEEHEIERLYSFKDFVKYRCDFLLLNILIIPILLILFYYLIVSI